FRIAQKNVVVAAWNIGAASAAFGDIDGDGRPDIAVVCRDGEGSLVKVFLNKGGKFDNKPDHEIALPGLAEPGKVRVLPAAEGGGPYVDVRMVDVNGDGRPDLVTSYGAVYLRGADGKLPAEPTLRLPTEKGEWHFLAVGDFNGDKRPDVVLLSYGQTSARVFY